MLSPYLKKAYENYQSGYDEDLSHFYSGINALGLLTVLISLAENLQGVWELEYDTNQEADEALKKYKDQYQKLALVLQVSIEATKKRLEWEGKKDHWLGMTEADFACLTFKRPQRVDSLYEKVIQEANDLNFDSARRQLLIYEQLSVQAENVKAGLTAFSNAKTFQGETKQHYILFTGHMIDKPDPVERRFPPDKEGDVYAAIKETVRKEVEKIEGPIKGIAGGACGGDILFHKVCEELGISTELHLAIPREQYLVESVQFAGMEWVERFDQIYKKLPKKILASSKELPNWLQKNKNYSIWERGNLWLLYNALLCGAINMTLIALWDCKGGDNRGGAKHMVEEASRRGAKTIVIDINTIE